MCARLKLEEQWPTNGRCLNHVPCVAGAVFFSLVFLALTSLTTVDLLVNERGLVVKECLGGYYRPFSYYLSKGEPPPPRILTILGLIPSLPNPSGKALSAGRLRAPSCGENLELSALFDVFRVAANC